jgi:hypothetical protein
MNESSYAIHAHIRKQDDYQISNDTPQENRIVIKTEQGEVILTIDENVALMMAVDLVKAAAARMKRDIDKEIVALPVTK